MERSQAVPNYQALSILRNSPIGMSLVDDAAGEIVFQSEDAFAVEDGALCVAVDLAEVTSPVRVMLSNALVLDITIEDPG